MKKQTSISGAPSLQENASARKKQRRSVIKWIIIVLLIIAVIVVVVPIVFLSYCYPRSLVDKITEIDPRSISEDGPIISYEEIDPTGGGFVRGANFDNSGTSEDFGY